MSTSAAATTVEANANESHTLEPANPATSNALSSAQPSLLTSPPPLPLKTPQQMAEMFTQGNSQKQKVVQLAAPHDMLETAFAAGSIEDSVVDTVGSASASSSGGTSKDNNFATLVPSTGPHKWTDDELQKYTVHHKSKKAATDPESAALWKTAKRMIKATMPTSMTGSKAVSCVQLCFPQLRAHFFKN